MSLSIGGATSALALTFVLGSLGTATLSAGEGAAALAPGRPLTVDIAAGARHTHRLAVEAGQFLRVEVDQQGVDLLVELTDPSGSRARRDDDNAMHGPLLLRWVTEAAGEVLIDVYARVPAAGRYRLAVAEVRAATSGDGGRVRADGVLSRGFSLLKEDTSDSLRAAVLAFEEAAELYRLANDDWGLENALTEIGVAQFQRGEMEKALAASLAAVPIARRGGFRNDEATALSNAAAIHRSLGQPQPALELYAKALALKRELGERAGEATTLNNLGVLQSDLGAFQDALHSFQRARALHHTAGEQSFECLDLINLGSLYHQLGQDELALELLNEGLALARAVKSRTREGAALSFLARVEIRLGKLDAARAHLGEAVALHRQAGDGRHEARALIRLAVLDADAARWPAAFEQMERALALAQASDRRMEAAALIEMGALQARQGAGDEAAFALGTALELNRSFGDREGEALARHGLARLASQRDDLPEARGQAEEAIAIVESLRSRLVNFGLRETYLASLPALYELHVGLLMRSHARAPDKGYDARALSASERVRARTLLELLRESGADVRAGADPALLRREKEIRDQLTLALDRQVRLLSAQQPADTAAALARDIERLTAESEQAKAEIRARSPRFAALTQPQPLDLAAIQERVLDPDSVLLEYSLGEERSYLWAVTTSGLRTFELPGRPELERVARAAHAELSTRPAGRGARPRPALAALGRMVLDPARAELRGRRVLVVADGVLHYVPFGVLPDPDQPSQPLIEGHEVVGLPSASTLAILREERQARATAPRTLVVLADPVFSPGDERLGQGQGRRRAAASGRTRDLDRAASDVGFQDGDIPRLPFTRREARRILGLVPPGQGRLALDFEASRGTALEAELANYRFVHFATHGFLNAVHPELSGLLLSMVDRHGRPQEGFLSAAEAFNLKLGADLVVLSGCRTGLGKEIRGEGMIGLTRALMYAGAPRVVASGWKVDDEGTVALMTEFYRRMLGPERLAPAAALRAAQRHLRGGRWSDPYYWAAFQVHGEPN
jgi:CHAT domain-containing protein/Tfp pilus assembly protein PilF